MGYEIVGITDATRTAFEEVDKIVWFDEPTDPAWPLSGGIETGRAYAATESGEPPFAGIYAHYDLRLSVPDGDGLRQVEAPGVTWVGVHPDHRRQGVLTAMLTHHLAECRERGWPVSLLHASEPSIYGRFGYAVASIDARCEIGSGTTFLAPGVNDSGVTTRTFGVAATAGMVERISTAHRALATRELGQVTLPDALVRRRLHDHPMSLRGTEPYHVLLAERDGEDVGFAVFRRRQDWPSGMPSGTLDVAWMQAADAAVQLALVRRLVSFDLVSTVSLALPSVSSPIAWWAGGPRAVKVSQRDGLWVRVVDVEAALPLRTYATAVDVVLDIRDDRCPHNAGRWAFVVDERGQATCERTSADAMVSLDVTALGAALLGGRRVSDLAAQGIVSPCGTDGPRHLTRLDAAFATPAAPCATLEF